MSGTANKETLKEEVLKEIARGSSYHSAVSQVSKKHHVSFMKTFVTNLPGFISKKGSVSTAPEMKDSNPMEEVNVVEKNEEKQNEANHDFDSLNLKGRDNPSMTAYTLQLENGEDHVATNLLNQVEAIIKDRQFLMKKVDKLENEVDYTKEVVEQLRRDKSELEQKISDKNEEVYQIEEKMAEQQMNYNQLVEDYKKLQAQYSSKVKELNEKNNEEKRKYQKLDEDFEKYRQEVNQTITSLEAKIRNLKVENENILDKYHQALNDKLQLIQKIDDFTANLSSFSGLKSEPDDNDSPKPKKPNISVVE
ncbi:hypothetical protein EDD68_11423 [Melghiribacillus thermohalophilus]|uniref:Uncharacterized protein n=1 Tax=Melghiribacillus thermohalophilus TaxID=1324956 RepID=A0A4R3MXP5_9BACI|nr:hypothetical protein [Melghiribacillus thermohalophilus]TCT20341.1 hypothetical protein EDD68_11423 [Melghiribacillus thermohalophilus]